ncbi:hypothetical protein [Edwardsiella tarda]|uniref:hypothetical protein n=2 Tax=Edwardsiella tarda TaxID=636 RepID=UPI0002AC69B3|nr:hypothetical protein [Edwardsiella tarda]GAC64024.1 hypothetical protein ET1_08_00970 [Edwardsiella tarda ATCC 15947 = NBRC 105688]
MSESNKTSGENKQQPAQKPKPEAQPERNLRTGWTVIADSADNIADNIRKKSK